MVFSVDFPKRTTWPTVGGGGTVGQKGEVSQKFTKAYEFAFGSEVAETTERIQGTPHLNMFLKSICEQNLIS